MSAADDPAVVPGIGDGRADGGGMEVGHDKDHTDSHVEDSIHLVLVQVSEVAEPLKDGWDIPRSSFDPQLHAIGDDPFEILEKAATGDMSESMDGTFDSIVSQDFSHNRGVDHGGSQKSLADGLTKSIYRGVDMQSRVFEHDFAY